MYVELNGRRSRDPWSFRQTGGYHKFSATSNCNRVILLHPNDEALAQYKLENHAKSSHKSALAQHPLNIHLIVISSYLINWQDYIEYLASEVEQIVRIMKPSHEVADAKEVQRRLLEVVDTSAPQTAPMIQPDRLQKLRHLEDKIVCKACRCLRSTIVLVKTLMTVNTAITNSNPQKSSVHKELLQLEHRLEGHINAAEILAQRVQATLGLVSCPVDQDLREHGADIIAYESSRCGEPSYLE
jgi:hypothetical protein